MYLPMKLGSIYNIWLPLVLDSLPLKVNIFPLEAEIDAELMVLHCE